MSVNCASTALFIAPAINLYSSYCIFITERDNEVCDSECTADGCWGPGSHRCLTCAHFKYGDRCFSTCDVIPGLYRANSTHCMPCHEECESVCSGPGPEHCKLCKHVRNGLACAPFCPEKMYNSSGECKPCHPNCVKGCHGPENNIGPNGCISCEKAVINGNVVVSSKSKYIYIRWYDY